MDEALLERIKEWTARFAIRRGCPTTQEAAAVAHLFNAIYARQLSPDYITWQFGTAAPVDSVCLLAKDGDQIAGTMGLRVARGNSTAPVRAGLAVDLAVTPEARNLGLMARLVMELELVACELGCTVVHAMPNENAHHPLVDVFGWSDMPKPVTWTAPCADAQPAGDGLVFQQVASFGPEVDAIASAFAQAHPQLLVLGRDQATLNWRLVDNPRYDYHLFLVRDQSAAVGYLALKVFRDPVGGQSVGDVVDLLWSEDKPALVAGMLQFAQRYFNGLGINQTAAWLPGNTLLEEAGRRLGFQPTDQERNFCIKILDRTCDWLVDGRRWFLTMADSEVY